MSDFRALDISASALSAEKLRVETHLSNLANAHTTRTAEGGPYRRREVVFEAGAGEGFAATLDGVQAKLVVDERNPPRLVYDPGHPDADATGYVAMPAIDPVLEQADIVSAARSYEANLAVMKIYKDMLGKALELGK